MPSPRRKTTVFAVPRSTARSVPAASDGNLIRTSPRRPRNAVPGVAAGTVAVLRAGEAEVQESAGVGVHVRRVEDDRDQPPTVLRGGGDEAPARLVGVTRLDAVRAGVEAQEVVVVDVDLGVRGSNPAHVDLLRPHELVEARVTEGVPGEGRQVPRSRLVAAVADPTGARVVRVVEPELP